MNLVKNNWAIFGQGLNTLPFANIVQNNNNKNNNNFINDNFKPKGSLLYNYAENHIRRHKNYSVFFLVVSVGRT